MERHTEALRNRTYAAAPELKMTRILIASLMSECNEDHQTPLALAAHAAEKPMQKRNCLARPQFKSCGKMRHWFKQQSCATLERRMPRERPSAQSAGASIIRSRGRRDGTETGNRHSGALMQSLCPGPRVGPRAVRRG